MEAACILARRGDKVTVVEKSRLGGKMDNSAQPPCKSEMMGLIRFQSHEL